MRCWLYSFRPTSSWPTDVVTHLQDCQACRHLRIRLQRIDEGMSKLTGPVSDGTPQARLLDRIAATPQTRGQESEVRSQESEIRGQEDRRATWLHYGAYLAGMSALIAVAFILGHQSTPEPVEIVRTVEVEREKIVPVEVIREKIVAVHSTTDRNLFAALLKQNTQLVQSAQPADRLETLLDMAEACRQQALTLIQQGPRDSLPMTIDLYGQLLREGVLPQLARAKALARPALQRIVRGRLDKMVLPVAPAVLPRAVEDQRAALQSATQQALEWIDRPEEIPAKKGSRPDSASPSAALVRFAIAYSAEADAINRADLCADFAHRLLPSMMLCLTEDASPLHLQMGEQYGTLIRQGIYAPLALATAKEPPSSVKDQVSKIYQSAAQTTADIEEHLKQAGPNARPALQRALDATRNSNKIQK